MTTTAFPVRQTDAGVGCTDIALRHIVAACYQDTGILSGLTVKGGNSLSYTVSEGVAVCSKGAADGSTLAYFEGGSVDVSANSSSNPRVDVAWITSHDITQGDEDNLVTIGVTEGTAAASPVEPDVPSYATKLCAMQMPGGATTTSSATQYGAADMAMPYGASEGVVADVAYTTDRTIIKSGSTVTLATATVNVSSIASRLYRADMLVSVWARDCKTKDWLGAGYVSLKVDGVLQNYYKFMCTPYITESKCFTQLIELAPGAHTVTMDLMGSNKDVISSVVTEYKANSIPGQRLTITDLGAVE